jgi:hypothetical protein
MIRGSASPWWEIGMLLGSWCCCRRICCLVGFSDGLISFLRCALIVFWVFEYPLLVISGVRCLHTKLLAYWMCPLSE